MPTLNFGGLERLHTVVCLVGWTAVNRNEAGNIN
jgi:hypothetical protein